MPSRSNEEELKDLLAVQHADNESATRRFLGRLGMTYKVTIGNNRD